MVKSYDHKMPLSSNVRESVKERCRRMRRRGYRVCGMDSSGNILLRRDDWFGTRVFELKWIRA